MNSDIMSISRLRLGSDGEGISTLVAFYGCPLQCKYCLNEHCHKSYFDETKRADYTVEELIDVLKKDEIYYLMTGGGIVFGGGEPLLQSEFIHKVCEKANKKWKKRIETSLNVPARMIYPLLHDIDEWIIDIKDINPDIYKNYTQAENKRVLKNLEYLKRHVSKEKIHIRIPRIEGYNSEQDINNSCDWVRMNLKIEPEIFTYRIPEL